MGRGRKDWTRENCDSLLCRHVRCKIKTPFRSAYEARAHERRRHFNEYRCGINDCTKLCFSKDEAAKHFYKVHTYPKHVCRLCKAFLTHDNAHIKRHETVCQKRRDREIDTYLVSIVKEDVSLSLDDWFKC